MNQKHILPTRNYYSFFNHFSAPKNFPPSHIPPPTSLSPTAPLLPPTHLSPPYLPPTYLPVDFTFTPSLELRSRWSTRSSNASKCEG
jgi:hypothetical protein